MLYSSCNVDMLCQCLSWITFHALAVLDHYVLLNKLFMFNCYMLIELFAMQ